MQHKFHFNFADVARAFLLKYNIDNKFCTTTIASSRMIDNDRFEIVRRMENVMSSTPVYERIIFNRADRCVQGFTFEKESENVYFERYEFREEQDSTFYSMFLYKNPGLKKWLRYKLHGWGVQTLEQIIKKDQELKAKLLEKKEMLMETKEKIKEKKD